MRLPPWRRPSSGTTGGLRYAAFTRERSRTTGRLDDAGAAEFDRMRRRVQKRFFDLLFIWFWSPFIVLLLAFITLALKATMDDDVLYGQIRVGLDGSLFRMWKFRTMVTNRPGGEVTLVQDDRVTPLGRLLRPVHLDELPQVWNVLRGDMSLVGPRPEQPSLVQQYAQNSPEFERRLLVLPGMTGLAQIRSGYAGNLSETMIKLSHDLYYIEHQTVVFDLWILARTVQVIAARGGR